MPKSEHFLIIYQYIQHCLIITGKFFPSVQFSHTLVSDSLWPHRLQHASPPCPSPTSRDYSNSCPSSQWCHPTISSSIIPFSFCIQSFTASGSFLVSPFFKLGSRSIGGSALTSVLPMNIQDCFPLWVTGLISLESKGLFSNNIVQKHQLFGSQLSLGSNFHIHTWTTGKTTALTRQTFVGKVMSAF